MRIASIKNTKPKQVLANATPTAFNVVSPKPRALPSKEISFTNSKKRIKQSKANVGDKGFLSQLVIFTKAKQRYSSVMITKINFQKSRLSIDINSTKLSDVEALVKTLESSALTVKLENLTIKPEFSSGRLLLGN